MLSAWLKAVWWAPPAWIQAAAATFSLHTYGPLANPDVAAYQKAKSSRLFKLERTTMKVVGEYVYTLDDPGTFRRDPSKRQNDPRMSELMAIGLDRLVVLERTDQTTKLYEVQLDGATNIIGTPWDEELEAFRCAHEGSTVRVGSATTSPSGPDAEPGLRWVSPTPRREVIR